MTRICPDRALCVAGDACAGHCRAPSQPMGQFYTSDHGTAKYLVERAQEALPCGYAVKELPR